MPRSAGLERELSEATPVKPLAQKGRDRERVAQQSTGLIRSHGWFVACCVISLLCLFGSVVAAQTTFGDLLKNLGLLDYPPGMRPPLFSGQTSNGKTLSLAQLKGRVVLLNFWATWCVECRPEMPMFERLHREFTSQGLAVLGINVGEGIPAIKKYAEELGLTFPLILDPKGKIQASYGVVGLPTTFLLGRDGRPIALAIGPRNWTGERAKAVIMTLLAEPDRS